MWARTDLAGPDDGAGATSGWSRSTRVLAVALLGVVGFGLVLLHGFTAEDAFIVSRYSENLVDNGQLVFNADEPVSALTSPLNALLEALLYLVTGSSIGAYKVLGVLCVLGGGLLVAAPLRRRPEVMLVALAVALLPAAVLLWAGGGLETPLLYLFAAAAATTVAREGPLGRRRLVLLALFAGAAVVTRYDAAVFFGPLAFVSAWRAERRRELLVATAVGIVLPIAWLLVAWGYYGDVLPTSFYRKLPTRDLRTVVSNATYVARYSLITGAVPLALIAAYATRSADRGARRRMDLVRSPRTALLLGLVAITAYSLTMATHHMMFSFRALVPYLPAAALLSGLVLLGAMDGPRPRLRRLVLGFVALACAFQLAAVWFTYTTSLNAGWGEYSDVGARDYEAVLLEAMRTNAEDLRRHWESLDPKPAELPRVRTFAGGVLPLELREDSYVYEYLVSYRHFCTYRTGVSAHYLHILTPRHGSPESQLADARGRLTLVSSVDVVFEGEPEKMRVYYNDDPAPNALPDRIDGECVVEPPVSAAGRHGTAAAPRARPRPR